MRCLADGGKGVIRVCTQCNTGYHWLAPLLTTFGRRFPHVSVNVLADATDRPVQALLEGRLDLAILVGRRAIAGYACGRSSWTKWLQSSRRIIRSQDGHGFPRGCSLRSTC